MRESSNDANNNNAGGSGGGNGGLTFAFLSLGTISVSILLSGVAMHSSMSSTSSSSSSSLAKGIFIGSTSTITLFASGVYFACKFISSGGGTSRSTTSTSAECIEGEFVEKESLIGMNVRKEEMRGWLIFCKGSNMVKANKMSKEKGFAGENDVEEVVFKFDDFDERKQYGEVLRDFGRESGEDEVGSEQRRRRRKRRRGKRDGGGGEYYYYDDFFFFIIFGGRVCVQRGKFIDLKQCDVYLVEYPEGNKTELMWEP